MSSNDFMSWNSATSQDPNSLKPFIVLPKGTQVKFTVSEFIRATTQKGANMAKLVLDCEDDKGQKVSVKDNVVLLRSCEWKINQLFISLGLRLHGETAVPKWDMLKGASGLAKLDVASFQGDNGKSYDVNTILAYLEPSEVNSTSSESEEDLF